MVARCVRGVLSDGYFGCFLGSIIQEFVLTGDSLYLNCHFASIAKALDEAMLVLEGTENWIFEIEAGDKSLTAKWRAL